MLRIQDLLQSHDLIHRYQWSQQARGNVAEATVMDS